MSGLETLTPSTNTVNVQEKKGGKQKRTSPQDTNTDVAMTEQVCPVFLVTPFIRM
jgi:hypothetical protein